MKIVFCHPTGNANVRAVARTLASQNLLSRFYTSIAAFPGSFFYRLGGISAFKEFRRRTFDAKLQPYTHTEPWREMGRLFASKTGLKSLVAHETGFFSIDQIYRSLDRSVASGLAANKNQKGATAVYAYEDGAMETFLRAKQLGLTCIYDLPIAYWETGRRLMLEEAERLPEWAVTLGGGIKDSEAKLERKRKELALADIVIGPGSFVMDSLPEWAKQKNQIVSPFGSPIPSLQSFHSIKSTSDNRPLRVLFVGSLGQRKGLADLFAAMRNLKSDVVELIVMGSLLAPIEFYRNEFAGFRYEAGRSHEEVLELMKSCDVLCLPSIVEGRALVMQEAMSQGLPLIITANTGGEDLINDGETGFLVPIRSPECIAEKISWFLDNRSRIPEMGRNAQNKAKEYTWEKYGETIVNGLRDFL